MLYSITLTIKDGAPRIFADGWNVDNNPALGKTPIFPLCLARNPVDGADFRWMRPRLPGRHPPQGDPDVGYAAGREPDIRTYLPGETEVWSYPYKPNSNDVTAALLYTSSKDGDKGTFLDLKFVEGKLVSWQEAEHTLPLKGHTGIGMGINQGPIGNGTQTQPGAVHY